MKTTCEILKDYKTIAVVGISDKTSRASRRISIFLKNKGYNIVGVNPGISFVETIAVYKSLLEIPFEVDIINVFLNSNSIPQIIPDVLEKNPKVLWLQSGIRNDEAVKPVIEKGIQVLQDICIYTEYNNCSTQKLL